MRLNVLITHERFLPDFGGGGERIVFETARQLRNRGARVSVVTTGDPNTREYEGIPTRRIPVSRYRFNLAAGTIAEAASQADLIHSFNYHACLPSLSAGRRTGKPVLCTILGLFGKTWREMRGPVAGPLFEAWERMLVRRRYARTLFLSDYSRQQGIALGASAATCRTTCPGLNIGNGAAAKESKDGSVLFAGKLEKRKGVDDVLSVARMLPDIRFRIAGWGEEEQRLRSEAPANVEFLGFLEGEPLERAFARASVFLFPSRAETFGMVVAEAMTAGCAVVSSVPLDFEGARVQPGDVNESARAVARFVRDRKAAEAAGRTNRLQAARYTWAAYADSVLRAYEEVLRRPVLQEETTVVCR